MPMYGQLLGELASGGLHLLNNIEVITSRGAKRSLQQYIAGYQKQNAGVLPLTGESRSKLERNIKGMNATFGGTTFSIKINYASVIEVALRSMAGHQQEEQRLDGIESKLGGIGVDLIR